MKKSKILLIISAIILVVIGFFVTTQIPTTNPKVKDLPIIIVNNDKGQLGSTIVDKLKDATKGNDKISINWQDMSSKDEAVEEMNKGEYYGALIIPENFSANIASLSSADPKQTEFDIVLNQGKNTQVVMQVSQLLSNIVNGASKNMGTQLLEKMQTANISVPAKNVNIISNPIITTIENINTYGDLPNAGAYFFQPIWMASVLAVSLLFTFNKKNKLNDSKEKVNSLIYQVLILAIVSGIAGFSTPYFIEWILDITVPNITTLSIFLSICTFSFTVLILGFISWLGFAGLPVFGLLLFFGSPILQLAPEMVPSFYSKWVSPWLPMRPLFEGSRNILFFGQDVWNTSTEQLMIFTLVGLILIFASVLKKDKEK